MQTPPPYRSDPHLSTVSLLYPFNHDYLPILRESSLISVVCREFPPKSAALSRRDTVDAEYETKSVATRSIYNAAVDASSDIVDFMKESAGLQSDRECIDARTVAPGALQSHAHVTSKQPTVLALSGSVAASSPGAPAAGAAGGAVSA